MAHESEQPNGKDGEKDKGRTFEFKVDEQVYPWPHPRITGQEIMAAAGIPADVGLILIQADGTEEVVQPDQVINLAAFSGKFKRAPTFVRG